jgi:hypothetical protein
MLCLYVVFLLMVGKYMYAFKINIQYQILKRNLWHENIQKVNTNNGLDNADILRAIHIVNVGFDTHTKNVLCWNCMCINTKCQLFYMFSCQRFLFRIWYCMLILNAYMYLPTISRKTTYKHNIFGFTYVFNLKVLVWLKVHRVHFMVYIYNEYRYINKYIYIYIYTKKKVKHPWHIKT